VRIYLVRHGQSEWQLAPSTDWDTPLSSLGHEQAKRLGHWLAHHKRVDIERRLEVASLCTSPMWRAQQTATYVAEALGLAMHTMPALREASFHVAAHLPSRAAPGDPAPQYQPSARYLAFKAQVHRALDGLIEQVELTGGPVLAVTHGGLIKTMLRAAVGQDEVCFRLYNTGITELEWRRGRWHLVYLNLLDHLDTELRTR
jgi:broad specificity phosphatase PhoE